jgi:hypothetical protein
MCLTSFYGMPQMMDASNAINVFDAVDEEEEDRGGWGNKLDFLFSCISVSVGLGSKSSKKFRGHIHKTSECQHLQCVSGI